jgi:hypothetical protein
MVATAGPETAAAEQPSVIPAALRKRFGNYFDERTGVIGRVVGSEKEPAGAHQFCIWAADSAITLDVGHIVIACSEEAVVIGVVDEPRRYSDLRSFLDDYFDRFLEEEMLAGEPPTKRPEILVFCVNVLATQHLREDVTSHRPPVAGPVWFATREAIAYALDRPNFSGLPIPVLMHTNGNAAAWNDDGSPVLDREGNVAFQRAPIWVDEDYLLGPEAGHANWTGQSGLATKTSHALFLTSAIFQRMRAEGKSVAALMFNVKGPDLLWLDKPAVPDPEMEAVYGTKAGLKAEDLEAYDALGLTPEPFTNLRVFAPFKPGCQPQTEGGAEVVYLERELKRSDLNTLRRSPAESHCVYPVLWELQPFLYQPFRAFERADLDDKFLGFIGEAQRLGISTLGGLEKLFDQIERDVKAAEENGRATSQWHDHSIFTIRKARNRFGNLPRKFGGLLTDGAVAYGSLPKVDEAFRDGEVRVVDIAHCNSNVQEMLVHSVVSSIWRRAEESAESLGVGKVIVFVDELNKYAPGGGEGGLRDTLVEIAARGRHLNVVLFGAQQFRSKVETEILGNCGTSFYGRVGDEEIINPSYRSLSETAKAELLGLPKGRLLVRHAHFRSPLFGTFPYPPTIPGMDGQRIFNDRAASGPGDTHPGDGLYALLRRLMGEGAPSKSVVRTETDGFPRAVLEGICASVEERWRSIENTTAARRITPWAIAKGQISDNAHRRLRVIR